MDKFRTEVELLYLKEMVEEDMHFIMREDNIDDLIPQNTIGLFDDTSSDDNELDKYLDDSFGLF